MFQRRRKRHKRSSEDGNDEGSEESCSDEGSSEELVDEDSEKVEWGKKVEPELRRWIECEECRRDILDEYFNNPPCRKCKFWYISVHIQLLTGNLSTYSYLL